MGGGGWGALGLGVGGGGHGEVEVRVGGGGGLAEEHLGWWILAGVGLVVLPGCGVRENPGKCQKIVEVGWVR